MKPQPLSFSIRPIAISMVLLVSAAALAVVNLKSAFPHVAWCGLLDQAGAGDFGAVVALYSALPRIAVAVLSGMGLGLSGAMFQQVLRNPLAEPSTLGISSGAYLALAAASSLLPGLSPIERIFVAMLGAGLSTLLVMIFAWRHGLSVIALSLSGLTLNLIVGSLASVLVTFQRDGMVSLSFWGSGTLRQNDWIAAKTLAFALAPAVVCLVPTIRALALFRLGDETMSSFGMSVRTLRLLTLGLATWIAAAIVACVGIIGFVGLAAPWLARFLGARRMAEWLLVSAMVGIALLLVTDQLLIALGPMARSIPAGLLTAFLGAPVLLWVLRRPPPAWRPTAAAQMAVPAFRGSAAVPVMLSIVAAVLVLVMVTGRDAHDWQMLDYQALIKVLPWRWPRAIGSAAAGAALGIAGAVLQRLTGNPLASPEILGVSTGAVFGALLSIFIAPPDVAVAQTIGAIAGAAAVLALLMFFAHRARFSASHVLLVGIVLGTALSAVSGTLAILPDPRFQSLQLWIVGSTDRISSPSAMIALMAAAIGFAAAWMLARWQTILEVGVPFASSVGIEVKRAQFCLLAVVSVLSAVSTLIVGPLSFIGLMAPHLARQLGGRRIFDHLFLAALLGALIMMVADWLSRNLAFPYQIPAGLLATFVGGPYFLWLLRRRIA